MNIFNYETSLQYIILESVRLFSEFIAGLNIKKLISEKTAVIIHFIEEMWTAMWKFEIKRIANLVKLRLASLWVNPTLQQSFSKNKLVVLS